MYILSSLFCSNFSINKLYIIFYLTSIEMRLGISKNKTRRFNKVILSNETEEPNDLAKQLNQKFQQYFNKRRLAFLKEKLSNFYGKNFVINYQKRFNFEEQWEDKSSISNLEEHQNALEENPIEIGLSILTVIFLYISLWTSSIDLFFRSHLSSLQQSSCNLPYKQIYFATVSTICVNWILKIRKIRLNKSLECSIGKILKHNYQEILCLLSFILKLCGNKPNSNAFIILLELATMLFIYIRARQLYKSLRLVSYSLYYEYHSKICDLIITLFSILHITAIALFLSTELGYEESWLTKLNIDKSDELILYVYSFYLGSTTVFTVGYGDIVPKNTVEVVLIIIIQILGIATHGFIISEINYCISNLRKTNETIEKDLSIILKMKKHYKMNSKIISQARSFVANNTPKVDQLYPNEEKYLLQKFNEQLRNNIQTQNSFSVIKSSVFFITRWSLNFQRRVAKKIQHILFSPNDLLYQPKLKERIYIIKRGKIHIYAQKTGRKKGQKNLLKILDNNNQKDISDNCYGYTAVISTRPSRLYAIAKDITSAYYIDKEQFLQCLSERVSDYEYYHEIKSKIDQAEHWQVFEAPLIESSKAHYNPTKNQIIRRYIKQNSKHLYRTTPYKRRNNKSNLLIIDDQHQTLCIRCQLGKGDSKNISSFPSIELNQSKILPESSQQKSNEFKIKKDILVALLSSNQQKNLELYFQHYFDISKEYINYFNQSNRSTVIKKIQTQFFLPKSNELKRTQLNNQYYRSKTMKRI